MKQRCNRLIGRLGCGLLAACLLPTAWAGTWSGRVVGVHDGDTLTILRHGQGFKVRLNAIDAPELGQPYARQSRQALSALCYGRYARVDSLGEDKYGRTLGQVMCGGKDVNAEQLRNGYAWHYRTYDDDPDLQRLEDNARQQRRGLWASAQPQPPWEYRHGARHDAAAAPAIATRPQRPGPCGRKQHCAQMTSCAEATYYLQHCRLTTLDGNRDGVPCESLCTPER